MDLQLTGKTALITGGSKGIGLGAAELLAEAGVNVILVSRDQATLDGAAASVRARWQVNVRTIAADLSVESEVVRVAAEAGEIDILVNNAGAIPGGSLAQIDNETWRKAWDLKVFGFISLCRQVYPKMAARRSGVIVNVIGAAGETFPANYIAGAAGNASLMGFTRALGRASPADNVRVVGINPGSTATGRMETQLRTRARDELGDADRWMELCKGMPFGRPATVDEVASAVAFLASPRSGYTTGTILTIAGG